MLAVLACRCSVTYNCIGSLPCPCSLDAIDIGKLVVELGKSVAIGCANNANSLSIGCGSDLYCNDHFLTGVINSTFKSDDHCVLAYVGHTCGVSNGYSSVGVSCKTADHIRLTVINRCVDLIGGYAVDLTGLLRNGEALGLGGYTVPIVRVGNNRLNIVCSCVKDRVLRKSGINTVKLSGVYVRNVRVDRDEGLAERGVKSRLVAVSNISYGKISNSCLSLLNLIGIGNSLFAIGVTRPLVVDKCIILESDVYGNLRARVDSASVGNLIKVVY